MIDAMSAVDTQLHEVHVHTLTQQVFDRLLLVGKEKGGAQLWQQLFPKIDAAPNLLFLIGLWGYMDDTARKR